VDHRRSWVLISLVIAAVRGIIADKLITDARGFGAIRPSGAVAMRRIWSTSRCVGAAAQPAPIEPLADEIH
jgi:hypothetical protein